MSSALRAAANCWAMASQGSPRRIMAWMPRIWPSTRARRLSMASCCWVLGVVISGLQGAAQGEGAAQFAGGEAAGLILRVVTVEQPHQLGFDRAAMAGQAGLAGGDGAHVAEFAVHHFGTVQAGDSLAGLAAALEVLQYGLLPGIRTVVRVAQAQGGAPHFPGRDAVLLGDAG